jgi:glutamine cyclotransferase
MFNFKIYIFFSILFLTNYINSQFTSQQDYKVINMFEHDNTCFTQGLLTYKGYLYESCGLYGRSKLRKIHPDTGIVLKEYSFEKQIFAEGISVTNEHNSYLYALSWTNKKMFIFDIETFKVIGISTYETFSTEGWGLTFDGTNFIVSDGSDRITFYEVPKIPSDNLPLVKIKEFIVKDKTTSIAMQRVNELEYVNGYIYANVWYKDIIIKIDPKDGSIVKTVDLKRLYPKSKRIKTADCLNGISYNTTDKSFTLTGKLWPSYYRVSLNSIELDL